MKTEQNSMKTSMIRVTTTTQIHAAAPPPPGPILNSSHKFASSAASATWTWALDATTVAPPSIGTSTLILPRSKSSALLKGETQSIWIVRSIKIHGAERPTSIEILWSRVIYADISSTVWSRRRSESGGSFLMATKSPKWHM